MENGDTAMILEAIERLVRTGERTNEILESLLDRAPEKKERKKRESGPMVGTLPLLAQIWNDIMGSANDGAPFQQVSLVTAGGTRDRALQARWKENSDPTFWGQVIFKIKASGFCRGGNDRKWVANFDWLLKPDTAAKVIEGRYDAHSNTTSAKRVLDL